MNKFKLTLLFLLAFASLTILAQPQKSTEKLKRADCFFGVHFDLHASEDITDAGKTLTPEMVDTFLTKVQPDFIQIDCKGHPGISSYPTKVGFHVKGFEKDPLKLFREVTEKNKVALFIFMVTFAIMTPLGTLVSNRFPMLNQYYTQITAVVIGILFHISSTIIFESSEGHKFNIAKVSMIILGIVLASFL